MVMVPLMVVVMMMVVDLLDLLRKAATAPEPESAAQPGRTSPFLPTSKYSPHRGLKKTLSATALFPTLLFVYTKKTPQSAQ